MANHSSSPPARTLAAELTILRLENDQLNAEVAQLKEDLSVFEGARDHYADLYDFVSIACLTLDRDGAITEANRRTSNLLCYERRLLIGAPLLSLIVREHRRRFLEHLIACKKGVDAVTFCIGVMRGVGESVQVRMTLRSAGERDAGYAVALLDLRELEMAQAERDRLALATREAQAENQIKGRLIAKLSDALRGLLATVTQTGIDVAACADISEELRAPLNDLLERISTLRRRGDLLTVSRAQLRGSAHTPRAGRHPRTRLGPRLRASK